MNEARFEEKEKIKQTKNDCMNEFRLIFEIKIFVKNFFDFNCFQEIQIQQFFLFKFKEGKRIQVFTSSTIQNSFVEKNKSYVPSYLLLRRLSY